MRNDLVLSGFMVDRIKAINAKKNNKETAKKVVKYSAQAVVLLAIIYTMIGLCSLAEVASGADISYIPFWHTPWSWLAGRFL